MKIGFDGKRAFGNFTGLGNYSRGLLQHLSLYYPEHEYHLYSPIVKQDKRTSFLFDNQTFHLHSGPSFLSSWWRRKGMVRDLIRDKIDLYHGLSHEIPIGISKAGIPSVVTIHDLIFYDFRQDYPWLDRQFYHLKCQHACQNASHIVAISQQTQKDIIRHYHIPEEKISIIYQACHPQFYEKVADPILKQVQQKYALPNRFLLSVGSVIGRKNLLNVVKALDGLSDSYRIPLVVIGHGKAYLKQVQAFIQKKDLGKWVLFMNHVDFQDFPAVYQLAECMLYPSLAEGFGLPVLEAQASGLPVISSNCSALKESAGDAALLVDPNSVLEIQMAIQKMLDHDSLKAQLKEAGYTHAQLFLPEDLSRQLIQCYQKVLY